MPAKLQPGMTIARPACATTPAWTKILFGAWRPIWICSWVSSADSADSSSTPAGDAGASLRVNRYRPSSSVRTANVCSASGHGRASGGSSAGIRSIASGASAVTRMRTPNDSKAMLHGAREPPEVPTNGIIAALRTPPGRAQRSPFTVTTLSAGGGSATGGGVLCSALRMMASVSTRVECVRLAIRPSGATIMTAGVDLTRYDLNTSLPPSTSTLSSP